MPKKSKLKCPECHSTDIQEDHHDCPTCNCGTIYSCNKCWTQFDENGEEL